MVAQLVVKWARALLLAVLLAGSAAPCFADGEAASESKDEKPAKIEFSPEAEKKFAQFLNKVKGAKAQLLLARMDKEVEEIQKATKLSDEGAAALKAAAKKPIEESLVAWLPTFDQYFRKAFKNAPMDISAILDQVIPRAEMYAGFQMPGLPTASPTESPLWHTALKEALNADQLMTWDTAVAEKKRAEEGEIDKAMKTLTSNALEFQRSKAKSVSTAIAKTLNLSKDRADAVDALATKATEKKVEEWGKKMQEAIRAADAEQRTMYLNGNMSIGTGNDSLEQQPIWKEGLGKILTSEELKKLQDEKSSRAARRVKALGQIMLAELDARVAFTADQRERLQPIAEKLAKFNQNGSSESEEDDNAMMVQIQSLLNMAGTVKQEAVSPILDAAQWKRWKAACDPKAVEELMRQGQMQPWKAGPSTPEDTAKKKEPEFVENEISDFMEAKASKAFKKDLETMMLRAEDAGRVAGLPAENLGRLMTAARGAAEDRMESWKSSANSNLRSQIQGVGAQNVRQRLAGIQDYMFEFRVMNGAAQKNAVWDKAVKTELTAEQQEQWKKAVDDRAAFHQKSIAAWIIAAFDHIAPLTTDQWNQLQPKVEKIATDYEVELGNFFSGGGANHWYLQTYSMFIPLAGIPEKDFKGMLTKEQWDSWAGCNEGSNAMSYWGNIQQMHEQRVRQNR